MHDEHGGPRDPDGTRERLSRLERRVEELEEAAQARARSARRSRLLLLVGVALYVLVLSWELTSLV